MFQEWLDDTDGATAIEYVLMASMFALMALTAFGYLSDTVQQSYEDLGSSVSEAGE